MTSWKLVAGWVVVLVVTTALTWQIVALADNQVSDRPVAVAPSTPGSDDVSTTSGSPPTSSTSSTSSPTTATPGNGTTSSSSSSPSSSSSSSTPTSAASWSVRTITSEGGTVVVRYRPNEVELQAATPAPGFEMEIDDDGPQRVRVEFDNGDTDIRVEARWEDGRLDVEVSG